MRLPKRRRERRAGWFDPCIFLFFADTDLGSTRDRRLKLRKSGKPDLRGSFHTLAVPDL
jgi:hypothetical protein